MYILPGLFSLICKLSIRPDLFELIRVLHLPGLYSLICKIVSDGMADGVDVVYVNIVTWSVGCVRVGEVANGEQSIANQGQEWMGICATIKKAGSPSK